MPVSYPQLLLVGGHRHQQSVLLRLDFRFLSSDHIRKKLLFETRFCDREVDQVYLNSNLGKEVGVRVAC